MDTMKEGPMLAKLVDASIDPDRLEVASRAVDEELVPRFLAHDGALLGYWMADPASGHVLAITMWRDDAALREAAATDGAERASVAARIGLVVHAVHALPLLAAQHPAISTLEQSHSLWVRVTWVEGVPSSTRAQLPQLYQQIVDDQSDSAGFCGSYWIGDEHSGEGCALSVWRQPDDLHSGAGASRRRQRHVSRELGCRISEVRHYRTFGTAVGPTIEAMDPSAVATAASG
jgi:hypothetical protein